MSRDTRVGQGCGVSGPTSTGELVVSPARFGEALLFFFLCLFFFPHAICRPGRAGRQAVSVESQSGGPGRASSAEARLAREGEGGGGGSVAVPALTWERRSPLGPSSPEPVPSQPARAPSRTPAPTPPRTPSPPPSSSVGCAGLSDLRWPRKHRAAVLPPRSPWRPSLSGRPSAVDR